MMRIQIVSRKFVNPSSSTLTDRRSLKIPSVDQLLSPIFMGTIFNYPANENNKGTKIAERRKQLEKSLSEILTIFYPMAGRYVKRKHVG